MMATKTSMINRFVLEPHAIPGILFRVQNIAYYLPPCDATANGIYALNSGPSIMRSIEELAEEVDNHVNIAGLPNIKPLPSQWQTPFLTVFSKRVDAENFLKSQGEKPGSKEWVIYEVSGPKIAAGEGKVLPMNMIRNLGEYGNQFLIWKFIPQEALVAIWEWGNDSDGIITRQRKTQVRIYTRIVKKGIVRRTSQRTQKGKSIKAKPRSMSREAEEVYDASEGSETSEGSEETQLADPRDIKSVVDHYPAKSNITNAKWYRVTTWEGSKDEGEDWRLIDDVPEEAIDKYWEAKEIQRKRRRTSKRED